MAGSFSASVPGWNAREHALFGHPLGDIPTRMARFTEALEVMTRLIRQDEPQTFTGQCSQLHEATLRPRPKRHTPVIIGGSGPQRTLPLVARYADSWNATGSVDEVRERNALLDTLLVKGGRAPGAVKRTLMKGIFCGRDASEYAGRLRGVRSQVGNAETPQGELLARARTKAKAIVGTPQEVAAQMRAYGEAGIEEIMAQFVVVDDLDGLRVLARDVLPLLE